MATPEKYMATFHTHAGAIKFERKLKAVGGCCKLMPVPRKVSSSCGVCARFDYDRYEELIFDDMEAIYEASSDGFAVVWKNSVE
jgi:hypothetical protein